MPTAEARTPAAPSAVVDGVEQPPETAKHMNPDRPAAWAKENCRGPVPDPPTVPRPWNWVEVAGCGRWNRPRVLSSKLEVTTREREGQTASPTPRPQADVHAAAHLGDRSSKRGALCGMVRRETEGLDSAWDF
jgi:hypothetical protein